MLDWVKIGQLGGQKAAEIISIIDWKKSI